MHAQIIDHFFFFEANNVPTEQLKSQMFACACVYFGMPPHAGRAADPQLPNINPESIHLFSMKYVV